MSLVPFRIKVFPRIVPLLDGVVLNDPSMCVASCACVGIMRMRWTHRRRRVATLQLASRCEAWGVSVSIGGRSHSTSSDSMFPSPLPPPPLRPLLRFVHIGDPWPAPGSAEWDALKGSTKYVGRALSELLGVPPERIIGGRVFAHEVVIPEDGYSHNPLRNMWQLEMGRALIGTRLGLSINQVSLCFFLIHPIHLCAESC